MSSRMKAINSWRQFAIQNSSKLKLKCGRNLVYSEYGAPNGFPLIHFHAALSSRIEPLSFSEAALKRNIRIICADRPGAGLSDIDPNITYESYCNDTEQLLNHLNIEQGSFGFSGVSQGGSYVLAHLYYLQRLQPKIGALISSISQYRSNEISLKDVEAALVNCEDIKQSAKLSPYPILTQLKLMFMEYTLKYAPDLFMKQLKSLQVSEADAKFFADPVNAEAFLDMMKYSMHKHGAKGWTQMSCIGMNEWGFNLKDIDQNISKILCYHGSNDTLCPLEWQQLIADKMKYEIKVFENEGHIMIANPEVVDAIFDDIEQNINALRVEKVY